MGVFSHSATNNDDLQDAQDLERERRLEEEAQVPKKEAEDMESLATLATLLGVNVDDEGNESLQATAAKQGLVAKNL